MCGLGGEADDDRQEHTEQENRDDGDDEPERRSAPSP
jgi:hypothetical protein